MNNTMANLRPIRMFLGVPQTSKIQVYAVSPTLSAIVTQAVLSNTSESEANLTLTINTIDIMQNYTVAAGETKIIDLYIVLNDGDSISLQQNVENAINVTLNGSVG